MTTVVPKVSVAMLAYNHEKFIAQAIEGVLMQKTDFPVELVIGEDQSTDGTRAICQQYADKYPDRIRLFLRDRNDPARTKGALPASFNIRETYRACRGEYVAYLDGDDYWIDDQKLAIQAATLDAQPDTVISSHRYYRLFDGAAGTVSDKYDKEFEGRDHLVATYQDFLEPLLLLPSCMMFRRSELAGSFEKQWGWDVLLWGHLLSKGGKAVVVNRFMSVYRKHQGGVWTRLSQREVNKWWHVQNTQLVANEGFKSFSIKDAYMRGTLMRSADLMEMTVESLRDWHSHAAEAIETSRKNSTPPQNASRVRPMANLMCAVYETLLDGQAEYLKMACTPRKKGERRAGRYVRLAILALAVSPLALLLWAKRAVRGIPPSEPSPPPG